MGNEQSAISWYPATKYDNYFESRIVYRNIENNLKLRYFLYLSNS